MDLKKYIRTVPDFPKKGISFKDITPLLNDPLAFARCIQELREKFADVHFGKIGAFDARGFLFGAALAHATGVPLFPIRKKGKLPYDTVSQEYALEYGMGTLEIHTDAVWRGEQVLLVDDLLATGGTMKAGCELVEKLGGRVAGCALVIELEELGGRKILSGRNVRSLITY